jgi:hypothetical protein
MVDSERALDAVDTQLTADVMNASIVDEEMHARPARYDLGGGGANRGE